MYKPRRRFLPPLPSSFVVNTFNKQLLLFLVKQFHGEVLKLKRVQRNQMGAYLCIASNSVPPSVSKRIRLNVNCKLFFNLIHAV